MLGLTLCLGCSDHILPRHPTLKQPGKYSLLTGLGVYTHEPLDESHLQLTKVKKSYEKSILYYGEKIKFEQTDTIDYGYKHPFYPPNALPISDSSTLDISEVANLHYLEFLNFVFLDTPQHNAIKYIPLLDQEFLKSYFYNPDFYFYPVVGVNREQAEAYCKWRAQVVTYKLNEATIYYKKRGSPKMFISGESYYLIGRLPTAKEWLREGIKAYTDLDSVEYVPGKKAINYLKNGQKNFGYSSLSKLSGKIEPLKLLGTNLSGTKPDYLKWGIPFYIFSYKPSSMGYYNLIGNVAELIQEGYAIGGSYESTWIETLSVRKKSPAKDVGFRCVCEVKEQ